MLTRTVPRLTAQELTYAPARSQPPPCSLSLRTSRPVPIPTTVQSIPRQCWDSSSSTPHPSAARHCPQIDRRWSPLISDWPRPWLFSWQSQHTFIGLEQREEKLEYLLDPLVIPDIPSVPSPLNSNTVLELHISDCVAELVP